MTSESDFVLNVVVDHPVREAPVGTIERLLQHAIRSEAASVIHLEVILTDHDTVLDLNRRYLEHDYLTDVLAFNMADDGEEDVDGEIYVDLDTAAERCAEFGETYEREVARYALHGLLHLLGYSDDTDAAAQEMKDVENNYLQSFESSGAKRH